MSSEDVNHKGILLTGVSFTLKSMSFLITIMLVYVASAKPAFRVYAPNKVLNLKN